MISTPLNKLKPKNRPAMPPKATVKQLQIFINKYLIDSI